MIIHYAITKQEPSKLDRFKIRILRFILPKQIIVDFDDNFRKRLDEL